MFESVGVAMFESVGVAMFESVGVAMFESVGAIRCLDCDSQLMSFTENTDELPTRKMDRCQGCCVW